MSLVNRFTSINNPVKSLSAALLQRCTNTGILSELSLEDTADGSQISCSEGGKQGKWHYYGFPAGSKHHEYQYSANRPTWCREGSTTDPLSCGEYRPRRVQCLSLNTMVLDFLAGEKRVAWLRPQSHLQVCQCETGWPEETDKEHLALWTTLDKERMSC